MNQEAVQNENNNREYDLLAKVLIIGDSAVGKTCLLLRFSEDKFIYTHLTTIGLDFRIKRMNCEGKRIKMQIWDTAGQDRFKTITQSYYRGAMGIILTYACNDRESFKNIENWVKQINQNASEKVCKILVGNKCDLRDRTVTYDEGKSLAESFGMEFFETSAKENLNIDQVFDSLAKQITEEFIIKRTMSSSLGSGIVIVPEPVPKKKKGLKWLKNLCFFG